MSSIDDAGALAQPQDGAQTHVGTLVGPAELAKRHGLKRQHTNGQIEWHGPNPSGHGAQRDGFILKDSGDSFERNGQHYTSTETARLFGIKPEQYAPCAEFAERNGHSSPAKSQRTIPQTKPSNSKLTKRPVAPFNWERAKVFTYRDDSTILFQVGRCDAPGQEKSIRQRRPVDPKCTTEENAGGWVHGLGEGMYEPRGADFYPVKAGEQPKPGARDFPETKRVLYHRADVLDAKCVHIHEGEKAADAHNEELMKVGLYSEHVATTSPHGGGHWKDDERGRSYSADLEGKHVVFYPDNDEPGARHLEAAAPSIQAHAARLQVLALPDLPDRGDVADFLEAGGTADELLDLAERAPDWAPTTSQAEAPHRRFVLRSLAEIKARPRLGWLIDGVVPLGGFVGIVGQYGSYKSFVAIDWALCVATGRAWHGREVKPGHVVYITPEGTDGISDRVEAWCIAHGEERPENFHLIEEAPQLMQQRDVDELLEVLSEIPNRIALVVVDTVARHMVGGDENGQKDMGTFVAGADAIRRATGATLAAIHHTNKEGGMRGSTVLPGALDCYLTTYRTADKCITLGCGKAPKDGPGFTALGLRGRVVELGEVDAKGRPLTSLVFLSDPQGARAPELTPTAKKALAALPAQGARRVDWIDASGLPESSFDRARKELESGGHIKRDDANVYKASNVPPRYLHGTPNGGTTTPTLLGGGGGGGTSSEHEGGHHNDPKPGFDLGFDSAPSCPSSPYEGGY